MAVFAGQWGPDVFIDQRGNKAPGAVVTVLSEGGTPAVLWGDRDKTAPLANPLPQYQAIGEPGLDVNGNGTFFAEPGEYTLQVVNRGVTVFDGGITVMADPDEPLAAVSYGLLADRPAASAVDVGALYVATDGLEAVGRSQLAQSDGSAWRPVMAGVPAPLGLYQRTTPTPVYNAGTGATATFRALAVDPNHLGANGTGRVWVRSNGFTQIGYTDDDGATYVGKVASPGIPPQSAVQMLFTTSHVWLVTTAAATLGGQVWRAALPDANGNPGGATWVAAPWVKIWDGDGMALGPGGAAADSGEFSVMRNACLAVDGASGQAFLVEYSSAPIPGGPSLYYSANATAADGATVVWTKAHTWDRGKHCHAVKLINNRVWVSIGDLGYGTLGDPETEFVDVGLWVCSTLNGVGTPANWIHRSTYGLLAYLQVINFMPVTIGGQQVVVGESDTRDGYGPILFPDATGTRTMQLLPLHRLPAPYVATMRQLTLDPDTGNLYWCATGESGAIGPVDSLWVSPPPYVQPYLLEAVPLGTFTTMGDPVLSNGYYWCGVSRVRLEKFAGQEG